MAVATLAFTLAASFPMVAFYAFFIEPGRPQAFYNDAAQWIAPLSSHLIGPLVFIAFNYWLSRRSLERNPILFAAATIVLYALVDLSILQMMGMSIAAALTVPVLLSLGGKAIGAFLGGYLGSRSRAHSLASTR